MAFKKVVVKLHEIVNEQTGDDSGDQLEIFGHFDVARLKFRPDIGDVVRLNIQDLFDLSSDNAADVDQGGGIIVNRQATLRINQGEFLNITGHLVEEDDGLGGADDQLGGIDIRLPFNNIADGPIQLPIFQESDQRVSVRMSMFIEEEG